MSALLGTAFRDHQNRFKILSMERLTGTGADVTSAAFAPATDASFGMIRTSGVLGVFLEGTLAHCDLLGTADASLVSVAG